MGPFFFIFIIVLVVVFVVALPALSGVGKFEIDHTKTQTDEVEKEDQAAATTSGISTYVPPDEYDDIEEGASSETKSKRQLLKEKLDKVNVPLTFKADLGQNDTGLRKRKAVSKSPDDDDPNVFDFKIEDLIDEDERQQAREYQEKVQAFVKAQKSKPNSPLLP